MRYWGSGSAVLLTTLCAYPQTLPPSRVSKNAIHRTNELTLARLRPGRDLISKARQICWKTVEPKAGENTLTWASGCQEQVTNVDIDPSGKLLSVRIGDVPEYIEYECVGTPKNVWVTGHGLAIGDPESKVSRLYGPPDSRSPSTKGRQQLELLYYAFDWAGPDVPQVMEALCTPEKAGKPGRVVELTLTAQRL